MSGPRIESFVLRCPDPARTALFYQQAFNAIIADGAIRIGGQTIHLAQAGGAVRIAPANATSFQHFAIVVSEMAAAYAQLRATEGWSPITQGGPVRLPDNAGGVTAFKFRDPDGHPLEYLAFAAGRTPAVWRGGSLLFAGIDHTAITVTDTQDAVDFYAPFGFQRGAGSRNEGSEQAALDGLPDPLVEVTPLTLGDRPPHLELLCYRRPGAYADVRPDNDPLATELRIGGVAPFGSRTDPDGHRIGTFDHPQK
jgi:catechol 2,3-dioxygenase-like lactoylglutathione lyase family enzyme